MADRLIDDRLRVSNPCTNPFILSQQGKGSDDCDHRNLKTGQSLPDKCNSDKGKMSSKSDKGKMSSKSDKGKGKGKGGSSKSSKSGKGKGKGKGKVRY
jgi:hypothetical protein